MAWLAGHFKLRHYPMSERYPCAPLVGGVPAAGIEASWGSTGDWGSPHGDLLGMRQNCPPDEPSRSATPVPVQWSVAGFVGIDQGGSSCWTYCSQRWQVS